jgi:arginyl-tRNA synthetase
MATLTCPVCAAVVKADDLIDALVTKATEAVREGGKSESLNPAEMENLGRQIAIGALRYFMLKFGRNKVIAFDFDEALTFEGDSGPYLQYSTVRVKNIFRRMAERGVDARLDDASLDALTLHAGINDDMWELVRLSAELPAAAFSCLYSSPIVPAGLPANATPLAVANTSE